MVNGQTGMPGGLTEGMIWAGVKGTRREKWLE